MAILPSHRGRCRFRPEIFAFRVMRFAGPMEASALRHRLWKSLTTKILVVILAERRVEDVGDFFARGLVEKRGGGAPAYRLRSRAEARKRRVEAERNRYQRTSVSVPATTPRDRALVGESAPEQGQNYDRAKRRAEAAPAFSTMFMIACAPSPLLDAIIYAMTETIRTTRRPTQRISLSDAFLRKTGL